MYIKCELKEIPEKVRFDTPGYLQGQIVEISYGGFSRWEHHIGDLYKRIIDHSDNSACYYKWKDE